MNIPYKALDLKNEIDKYRYFIGNTRNLSSAESIYLYNYSSNISKLYADVYSIEIRFSDYITNTLIEIEYGDLEYNGKISYKLETHNVKNFTKIVDLFINHIEKLINDKNYKYSLPYNK